MKRKRWLEFVIDFIGQATTMMSVIGVNDVQSVQPLKHPLLKTESLKVGNPMQMAAIDIMGPFPESESGNSYIVEWETISPAGWKHTPSPTKKLKRLLVFSLISSFSVFHPLSSYSLIKASSSNLS